MNKKALFCDGTASYVLPPEPLPGQEVYLRFRVRSGEEPDVYLLGPHSSVRMQKESTKGLFDYYFCIITVEDETFRYCFRVEEEDEVVYYDRCGISDEVIEDYAFEIIPGFSTPDWAKGAVMYQIFVDRFCNGDPANDVEDREYYYIGGYSRKVTDWSKYPETYMGIREFYGGDLQGIIDKLDYLQDLGIEVLYLNPVFVSPSNHKYDIQDYTAVDPHYGRIVHDGGAVLSDGDRTNKNATEYKIRTTDPENLEASNDLLAQLSRELHRRGMRLILDGVFNHCGSFNRWLDRERIYEGQGNYPPGAYLDYNSPYHDYFRFFKDSPQDWPMNGSYDGWWAHDTLPKLNYEGSVRLQNEIYAVGKKWIDPPYNADGWRLDVAADLGRSKEFNHHFWKDFRRVVKSSNPEALILAEHYGDPKEWLQGDEWDTIMNYDAFMEPVSWFLTGMEKHSDESRQELLGDADIFVKNITHHMTRLPTPALYTSMNELSNHDHSRFLTRTNHMVGRAEVLSSIAADSYVSKGVMRLGVLMQMTWVGAPTVYYGDEAGVCGFTDPDNRRTYPWGQEDESLIDFHKDIIRIHKEHKALKTGSLQILKYQKNMLAYARFDREEQLVIIINMKNELAEYTIPVWRGEVPASCRMQRLIYTYEHGYVTDLDEYIIRDGELVLNMGAYSAVILKVKA